jgi:hypothetical protein
MPEGRESQTTYTHGSLILQPRKSASESAERPRRRVLDRDRGQVEQVNATCIVLFKCAGFEFDEARNAATGDRVGRITCDNSRLHAYVIPTEEG